MSPDDYRAWIDTTGASSTRTSTMVIGARKFQDRWPDLEEWFEADIRIRANFCDRAGSNPLLPGDAHSWMPYLKYLSLVRGYQIDYPFLFSRSFTSVLMDKSPGPVEYGIKMDDVRFIEASIRKLDYGKSSPRSSLNFCLGRILLHKGDPCIQTINTNDITEFRAAIYGVCDQIEKDGIRSVYFRRGSKTENANHFRSTAKSRSFLVHQGLFQAGLVDTPPQARDPRVRRYSRFQNGSMAPGLGELFALYCKTLEDRGELARSTQDSIASALHNVGRFLYKSFPQVDSIHELRREHIEAFLSHMRHDSSPSTGRPYSITYFQQHVSAMIRMLEELHMWGYTPESTLGLISRQDMPKPPVPLPRALPADQLKIIDQAIDNWPELEQKAALLVLRWTGARRDEVRRLTLDSLSSYADGHPKIRLPAGKTGKEREVPLHPKAAEVLKTLIDRRKKSQTRRVFDERAAQSVHFLFFRRGRLLSHHYLIEGPLREICRAHGLVAPDGRTLITSHRFRHTVGTQMAENGAQLQTIMSMLGHETPFTALIYARMSDKSVRDQYTSAVLGDLDAAAGPGIQTLEEIKMTDKDVNWLRSNFLKTSLELGHCLRLPGEGPCECDLFLSCSKFVTTPHYLPKLQEAASLQEQLIADANERGWVREAERHERRLDTIHKLIRDLSDLPCTAERKSQHPINPPLEEF